MDITVVAHLVGYLIQLLGFAILVRSLLSWFPVDPNGPIVQAVAAITDPILEPPRRVIPPIGAIDFTPLIAMVALFAIAGQLTQY